MGASVGHLTLGAEEEFHVIDLTSRKMVPRGPDLLERLPEGFVAELQQSMVELNTSVCDTLGELEAELRARRQTLVAVADPAGLGVVAAGSVPLVAIDDLAVTRGDRFRRMDDDYRTLVREQLICGYQVHVQVPDPDAAAAIVRTAARWTPTFAAMAASSPFWFGRDTGYDSFRGIVWQRWPTAGWPGPIASAAEYADLVKQLLASGVASDPGMIYFDVRPSAHVPTVELRVCDACPRVEDALLLAGLFRAVVHQELAHPRPEVPALPVAMYRAAMWRASRSGLGGDLVDLRPDSEGPKPVPAAELVRSTLHQLREPLEAEGDWERVSGLADELLGRGTSAARQRARRQSGELADVVDLLVAQTRGESP